MANRKKCCENRNRDFSKLSVRTAPEVVRRGARRAYLVYAVGPAGIRATRASHGLPPWLRCMLHRAFHHLCDSGHAQRQARRRALRPTHRRHALRHFWAARAAPMLWRPATRARHVRPDARTCIDVARTPRNRHAAT
ncbi:hypothetical protein PATSB16_32020 [Pandoraea thiooxydans]|nr:hypothetical protein PATSB16_32020 [Pandoraea thiooxydans]